MSVSSSCAPATVTANQSSRHCLVRSTRSSGRSRQARTAARLAISAVTGTAAMFVSPLKERSLSLSSHDMEDVPVLGVATRCDAVGLFLLEHLEVEALQQGERLVVPDESDAGATVP